MRRSWRQLIAAARRGLTAGRRLTGRVHRAERGATLTEFIIVLPIFLIIFSAILKMTLLQSTTVQLKLSATKQLWNDTLEQQTSTNPDEQYVNPRQAGSDSRTKVDAPETDRGFSDPIDREKFGGLRPGSGEGGTIGEAGAALEAPGSQLVNEADLQTPPSTPGGVTRDTGDVLQRTGYDYHTGDSSSMYTAQLVDDSLGENEPPSLPTPANNLGINDPPSPGASVSAYAGGTRYGLVQAVKSASNSPNAADALDQIPFIDADHLSAGYNTLIAPRPVVDRDNSEHFRPVSISRRHLGEFEFTEYSGIDFAQP